MSLGRTAASASTTRRVLAAVAVGAMLAAGVTIYLTGFRDHGELQAHGPGSSAPTGAVAGEAFGTARPGDCLGWTKPDASDLSKVDCSQRHLFEVAAEVDLGKYPGAEYAPGSTFPGQVRFAELKDELCGPAVTQYLHGRFDSNGKFSVGLINPGEAGWAAGERTLRCGIEASVHSGARLPIVGAVASQDQSRTLTPGTCIGINQNLPTDPVDCAKRHAFEVISTVDLTPLFNGPPSDSDQDKYMSGQCQKDAAGYLGSPDALRNKTLTLFWDHIDPDSWLGGNRMLNCMVGKGADQDGFAPIEGTAKGSILINGQPPVPPPPLPNNRPVR